MTRDAGRHTDAVRAYYERNTRLFLAFGLGREARAIHRAVWLDAHDYLTALGFVNRSVQTLVTHQAQRFGGAPVRVLDLGCGVGGTLLALADNAGALSLGVGLSISRAQVQLAARFAAMGGHLRRLAFVEGDFAHVPADAGFAVVTAIESLVHAASPAAVLREAAAALRSGGLLAICDDMLVAGWQQHGAASWVKAFRRGWHAPGLAELSQLERWAGLAGLQLVERRDLTPHLRLLQTPNAFVEGVIGIGGLLPERLVFLQSLVGGLALQHCLRHGVIGYHWLVFEKI
jgi:SAM-dependent methyltransferase